MVLFRSPFGSFNLVAALFYKTRKRFSGWRVSPETLSPGISLIQLKVRGTSKRRRGGGEVLIERSCGINRSDIEHPF